MSDFNIVPIKPEAPAPAKTQKWEPPVRASTDHLPVLDTETLPSNMFWDVLGTALTLRRDYESSTEAYFCGWLCRQLPVTMIDAAGNIHVDTRTKPEHRSMFTAHVDTVHNGGGANEVRVDGKFWRAGSGAALGADDGAGCAILAYMIEQGVPGYYVFFRGEERGGVGSKWLSENMPELFEGQFDRAIAFDRAGYYDVITHQAGGRCCSDEFAQALSDLLGDETSWFTPCNGGVYTDTAEFIDLIPECTNVSVGYKNQHGDREELDVEFCWWLAKGCVSVDWDSLPTKRDPKKKESLYSGYGKADWYGDYDYQWDSPANVSNGVYYGEKLGIDEDALLADLEDPNTPEGAVLAAIEAYREGRKDDLLEMVSRVAYPEDPASAKRLLTTGRIWDSDLLMAEDMLFENWTADAVLIELFDSCAAA